MVNGNEFQSIRFLMVMEDLPALSLSNKALRLLISSSGEEFHQTRRYLSHKYGTPNHFGFDEI